MKNNHGGKRKNSGRKPTGRTLEKKIMIKPEHWEKLQEIGGKHKVSETIGLILEEKFAKMTLFIPGVRRNEKTHVFKAGLDLAKDRDKLSILWKGKMYDSVEEFGKEFAKQEKKG